ncbi:MAG: hypothetical protein K9K82_13990 [Desulfobacteraceae bacterium]|nr:hypothetical protein [Desulfobacteraceae bacterium]
MMLFTDGSVRTQTGIGFGAFVAVDKTDNSLDDIAGRIQVKRFDCTSSTRLELETLLWALSEIRASEVTVYTDSQNIQSLLERRPALEKRNYHTKSGKLHQQAKLYKAFFARVDRIDFRVIKVSGHCPNAMMRRTDRIFSLVDKASRNALRAYYARRNHFSGR